MQLVPEPCRRVSFAHGSPVRATCDIRAG